MMTILNIQNHGWPPTWISLSQLLLIAEVEEDLDTAGKKLEETTVQPNSPPNGLKLEFPPCLCLSTKSVPKTDAHYKCTEKNCAFSCICTAFR